MAEPVSEFRIVDSDEITPYQIEHRCEELFDGERLSQFYNYFVYEFRCGDLSFSARAYTDEIGTVSLYGPFDRSDGSKISGELNEAVLSFLKRRFQKILVLGQEGYTAIWSE